MRTRLWSNVKQLDFKGCRLDVPLNTQSAVIIVGGAAVIQVLPTHIRGLLFNLPQIYIRHFGIMRHVAADVLHHACGGELGLIAAHQGAYLSEKLPVGAWTVEGGLRGIE